MDFLLWSDSLLYPQDTFRAEKERPSWGKIIKNVGIAGLIYGALTGLICDVFPNLQGLSFLRVLREIVGGYMIFSSIFFSPFLLLFLLVLVSSVIFISARIFRGYSDFLTQTYLLSCLGAPLILISVLATIPLIGPIIVFLAFLYALKPLEILLQKAHRYDKRESILTLILSFFIFLVLGSIISLILWQAGFSVFSLGETERSAHGFKKIKVLPSSIHYYKKGELEFEIMNNLNKPVIITELVPKGGCLGGEADLNKKTPKRDSFAILSPNKITEVKVSNCSRKIKLDMIRSKFSVSLQLKYQEKKIGKGSTYLERGILEGMVE